MNLTNSDATSCCATEAWLPLQRAPGDERRLGPARADATVVGARGRDGFHMAIPSTSEVVQQSTSVTEKSFDMSSCTCKFSSYYVHFFFCRHRVKLCNESPDLTGLIFLNHCRDLE